MRNVLLISVALCAVHAAPAQYYEPRGYQPEAARYLAAGLLRSEFRPRYTNPLADSGGIRYERTMPALSFRQGPVEAMFGYTRYTLEGETRESIVFSALFTNNIPLPDPHGALKGLLLLATDFTKAEAAGPQRESFNIVSLGIGAGLTYRQYSRSVGFSISLAGVAHYSFEGLSTGSGFSPALVGSATFLLPEVPVFDGVAIGYRFRLQTWAMSRKAFNYRGVFHGPYVGVMF